MEDKLITLENLKSFTEKKIGEKLEIVLIPKSDINSLGFLAFINSEEFIDIENSFFYIGDYDSKLVIRTLDGKDISDTTRVMIFENELEYGKMSIIGIRNGVFCINTKENTYIDLNEEDFLELEKLCN